MMAASESVSVVAIGRNEGDRLRRCLASLQGQDVHHIVYVDSGSTDGSVELANQMGALVVTLDLSIPFTAARARNAGLERVLEANPNGRYVQFLDGDCELADGWIAIARAALEAETDLAVVCGRRRERHPDASRWNRLVDDEWDTPIGEAQECGGDALMRIEALTAVNGYRDTLIAGEEPEMCYRMRQLGWRVRRIDAEMTLHDAALTRLSQWWQRTRRAGHAFAENAALHGAGAERFRVAETRRALVWGVGFPLLTLMMVGILGATGLLLLLAWPAQILRLRLRGMAWEQAFFMTFGKLPEAQGALGYWLGRFSGRRRRLIEYK